MADKYVFQLSHDGVQIIVNDPVGPLNDWESRPVPNFLIVSGGTVGLVGGEFVLGSGGIGNENQPVLALRGANWDSEVGDSGTAKIFLGSNGPGTQQWELIEKD